MRRRDFSRRAMGARRRRHADAYPRRSDPVRSSSPRISASTTGPPGSRDVVRGGEALQAPGRVLSGNGGSQELAAPRRLPMSASGSGRRPQTWTVNRELAVLTKMLRLAYENRKLLRLPVYPQAQGWRRPGKGSSSAKRSSRSGNTWPRISKVALGLGLWARLAHCRVKCYPSSAGQLGPRGRDALRLVARYTTKNDEWAHGIPHARLPKNRLAGAGGPAVGGALQKRLGRIIPLGSSRTIRGAKQAECRAPTRCRW